MIVVVGQSWAHSKDNGEMDGNGASAKQNESLHEGWERVFFCRRAIGQAPTSPCGGVLRGLDHTGTEKRAQPSQVVPSHVAFCAEFGLIWKVDSWKCEVAQNECFFSWSQWSFPEHLAHHCAFGLGCHHCSRRLPWDQVPLGTWLCSSSGTRLTRYKPT